MAMEEETTAKPPAAPAPHLRRIALPMTLGALAALACWWAAGETLGLYLGVLFMVALLAPVLAAGAGRSAWPFTQVELDEGDAAAPDGMALLAALVAAGAVVDGTALVLLAGVVRGTIGIGQWLRVYVLLLSYAAGGVGVVHLAARLGVPRLIAGAAVVVAGGAWLTWPVWLSPWLTDGLVSLLSPCHPVFALNRAVEHLGLWSEQAGVVYRHTSLNQDFPYALPTTIWPAVVLHLMICVAGALPALWHRTGR